MIRYLYTLIAATSLAFSVLAQDETPTEVTAEPETEEATAAEEEADAEEVEDADLDDQTYAEDDDDFVPTEEIPADEPIPFPTNI